MITYNRCSFGAFFNHIDHFPTEYFLYVTSGGIEAAKLAAAPAAHDGQKSARGKTGRSQREALAAVESGSEDEGELPNGGEEGG